MDVDCSIFSHYFLNSFVYSEILMSTILLKDRKETNCMKLGQAQLGEDVYSVLMDGKIHRILLRSQSANFGVERTETADGIARKVVKWIESGDVFTYPFAVEGTPFQQNVYEATQKIPKGKVTTYKVIAEKIGTKAYRAVGQALRANPVPLLIPCHRVIGSNGRLTGFSGGINLKRRILEAEGVEFVGKKTKKEYILEKI
jgi:O-6-methylguanine DNA methyltransferase